MNPSNNTQLKSAEEYVELWQQKVQELSSIDAGVQWCDEERIKFWKAALLDAYKAGMTEAARISGLEMSHEVECGYTITGREYNCSCPASASLRIEQAILSARDKKETL